MHRRDNADSRIHEAMLTSSWSGGTKDYHSALIITIHNQIQFPHCFVNRYKCVPIHKFSLPTVFTCAVVQGMAQDGKVE